MFYFSLMLAVLACGCRDAVISYSKFSLSCYSGDKAISLNPAPPEDSPSGSSAVPRLEQPGASTWLCHAGLSGRATGLLCQQPCRDSSRAVLQHVNP